MAWRNSPIFRLSSRDRHAVTKYVSVIFVSGVMMLKRNRNPPMMKCPLVSSSQMIAHIPRTWCCSTKLSCPDSIGICGAVQMIIAGARIPMTKQNSDALVSAKSTARVVKLRSSATTVMI